MQLSITPNLRPIALNLTPKPKHILEPFENPRLLKTPNPLNMIAGVSVTDIDAVQEVKQNISMLRKEAKKPN